MPLKLLALFLFALLVPHPATAQAEPASLPPVPAAPAVGARAHILLDLNSGAVLSENAADERMDPASITKLMTAYAVFSELRKGRMTLDEEVTVSERAWRTGGSRMFIEVGTRVPVED